MTPPRRPPVRPKPIPRRARRTPRQAKLLAHAREVLGLLVLLATLFLRERAPGLPPAVPVAKREEEAPPAVWSVDTRGPDAWWGVSSASRKLPSRPFPEQKRPPCTPPDEEAIAGGCWLALRSVAPCASSAFEHSGRCYHPVRVAQRPPTSFNP